MANINLAAALWLSMLYAPDEPLRLEEFLARPVAPVGVGPGLDQWLVGWFLAPNVSDEDPRAGCGHCPVGAGCLAARRAWRGTRDRRSIDDRLRSCLRAPYGVDAGKRSTSLSAAQTIMSTEAPDASSMAWAATNPGVDATPIQVALRD